MLLAMEWTQVVVSVDGFQGRRAGEDGWGDTHTDQRVEPAGVQEQGEGDAETAHPRVYHRARVTQEP